MARPIKDGVDYWPFNVDLLEDKKFRLIRAEFGIKGAYIALLILNSVYAENGYFKRWDNDDCFLMSSGVGDGCSPEFVGEVVRGCVRRSLFDQRVFDVFGVLTSSGIQRRFLRIVGNSRPDIAIAQEYWLLDVSNPKDVPPATLNKLTFFSVNSTENPVISTENRVISTENTQSKVKESKVKKNKEDLPQQAAFLDFAKGNPELLKALSDYDCMRRQIKKPMTERARQLLISELQKYPKDQWLDMINAAIMHNWLSVYPIDKKQLPGTPNRNASYDIESFERMAADGRLMER